jgi:hypothetical protein
MSHQPFETWILEEGGLSPQERQGLNEHIEECPHCRKLMNNFQAVHIRLSTAKTIAPAAGFSQRWQATLEKRFEAQHMKQTLQVRRFFLFLGLANILSLFVLIIFLLAEGNSMIWLAETASRVSYFLVWFERLTGLFFAFLHIAPLTLPLALWVTITGAFSILALIWVVSLWRINFKGVKTR